MRYANGGYRQGVQEQRHNGHTHVLLVSLTWMALASTDISLMVAISACLD